MRRQSVSAAIVSFLLLGGSGTVFSQESAQRPPSSQTEVSIVVSVEAKRGKEIPVLYREDVRVFQEKQQLAVKDWVALQGDQAGLELFLLIDDAIDTNVGLNLDDIRHFILAQPATSSVGVAYIRDGIVQIVQAITPDHQKAALALRIPLGAHGAGNPYLFIPDLVKRWAETPKRREILMFSDGIDRLADGSHDFYLSEAVDLAQRKGIQISTIYCPGAGHSSHSFRRFYWGLSNLSQLADQTGGEAYSQGFQTPISFAPFLDRFAERLQHQYRLTLLARPGKKAGYQRIRLQTEVPNAELVAAERIYVPAAR